VGLPFVALANGFDGSRPLLCSIISVAEWTLEDGSQPVSVESIALPRFHIGDVEKKRGVPAMDREGARYSDIRFMERVGGKVILQGAEGSIYSMGDGLGWTAALSEETGRFVLTASGEDAAFVVFGACIPY
jgi:hypothetical protein